MTLRLRKLETVAILYHSGLCPTLRDSNRVASILHTAAKEADPSNDYLTTQYFMMAARAIITGDWKKIDRWHCDNLYRRNIPWEKGNDRDYFDVKKRFFRAVYAAVDCGSAEMTKDQFRKAMVRRADYTGNTVEKGNDEDGDYLCITLESNALLKGYTDVAKTIAGLKWRAWPAYGKRKPCIHIYF